MLCALLQLTLSAPLVVLQKLTLCLVERLPAQRAVAGLTAELVQAVVRLQAILAADRTPLASGSVPVPLPPR